MDRQQSQMHLEPGFMRVRGARRALAECEMVGRQGIEPWTRGLKADFWRFLGSFKDL